MWVSSGWAIIAPMSDQPVTRFEARLERLIEGAFAQLFGRGLRAHDLAVHLGRAIEGGLLASPDTDSRPIAPDHYIIRLHQDMHDHLLIREPKLAALLRDHILELVATAGYRLHVAPVVVLLPDLASNNSAVQVTTAHQHDPQHTTQTLDSHALQAALQRSPSNPVLVIDGDRTVALTKPLINIGRGRDNDIILADQFISRHHVQLRLRHGAYFAFDVNSQSGITINDVAVREHRLQPGDVLSIGKTRLLYLEDASMSEGQTSALPSPAP